MGAQVKFGIQCTQFRDHLSSGQQYHHLDPGDIACEKSNAESEGGETKMVNPTSSRETQMKLVFLSEGEVHTYD